MTSFLSSTFSLLTCTVAVGDAAQNHSDSAQNVCPKKAAQNFLGGSSATGGHTVSEILYLIAAFELYYCQLLLVVLAEICIKER